MSMPSLQKQPKSSRRFSNVALIAIAVVAVAGGTGFAWFLFGGWEPEPFTGPTWTVKPEKLVFRIVERGTLESAENGDIYCRVKSRSKGSSNATTIRWIIEDGTDVVKGEKLVELDSSPFMEELVQQNIKVDEAHAASIKATEDLEIQLIQNEGDIATAKTKVLLSELELFTYLGEKLGEQVLNLTPDKVATYLRTDLAGDLKTLQANGEYFTKRDEILGQIAKKRSDLQMIEDRASWSMRMAKIGVVSRSQMEADQASKRGTDIDLRKLEGDLTILEKFSLIKTVTDLYSKVQEAQRELKRMSTQAKSKKAQAEIESKTKLSVYLQELARQSEIQDGIDKCTIYSPQDGLVVYFAPSQVRSRSGTQQSIVAQGEPVREGQKLMQIPDLANMQVNVRVHEAMVSRMHGDEYQPTRFSKYLSTLLTSASSHGVTSGPQWGNFLSPPYKYLRKKLKKYETMKIQDGQVALVRVDAYPSKTLKAHVKTVANTASQADFFSSDVRVYTTLVTVDEKMVGLKPGMSAEVTIYAEESSGNVLAIPIQSVVGTLSMGAKRKCFVVAADGTTHERDIVVGMTTNKLVEIKHGLLEGDKVVLNPRPLLKDDSNLKVGVPGREKRGAGDFPGAGKGKWKKGKDKSDKAAE